MIQSLALLELLGTRDRIVWQTDRLIRLREGPQITDMRLHALPVPFHLMPSFARARSVSWTDVVSNRRVLWMAMRLTERKIKTLDRHSALDILRHCGATPHFIEWFCASACISLLNVPLDRCSAGSLLRVFAQLTGLHNYAIGFADVGLSELFVPAAVRLVGNVCVAAVTPQSLARLLPDEWMQAPPFNELSEFAPSPYVSSYLWFDRNQRQARTRKSDSNGDSMSYTWARKQPTRDANAHPRAPARWRLDRHCLACINGERGALGLRSGRGNLAAAWHAGPARAAQATAGRHCWIDTSICCLTRQTLRLR